jgi:hypothetical protein
MPTLEHQPTIENIDEERKKLETAVYYGAE